ncbi:Tetrahydrofolate dehydrogenase/cyclohydrolase, NAD(P)-binding domain containing protein [Amanita muscaria]
MATPATILDGAALARSIRADVAAKIKSIQAAHPKFQPQLTIVQAGKRQDSSTYVRMKAKAADEVGITFKHVHLPTEATVEDVIKVVYELNENDDVSGILVQLPLGDHIGPDGEHLVTEAVSPQKDVDGFHPYNVGHLASRAADPLFIPCTAAAVMHILDSTNIPLAGAHAVVLGRSDIVGNPVAYLLKSRDATVTQCHSRSRNVEELVKIADIVVSAVGKPEFVKGSWLKPGAVVIDVGINFVPDSTKKSGQRLAGDVEFSTASAVASKITPVPGGVGPLTVAMLMANTLQSAERLWNKTHKSW